MSSITELSRPFQNLPDPQAGSIASIQDLLVVVTGYLLEQEGSGVDLANWRATCQNSRQAVLEVTQGLTLEQTRKIFRIVEGGRQAQVPDQSAVVMTRKKRYRFISGQGFRTVPEENFLFPKNMQAGLAVQILLNGESFNQNIHRFDTLSSSGVKMNMDRVQAARYPGLAGRSPQQIVITCNNYQGTLGQLERRQRCPEPIARLVLEDLDHSAEDERSQEIQRLNRAHRRKKLNYILY